MMKLIVWGLMLCVLFGTVFGGGDHEHDDDDYSHRHCEFMCPSITPNSCETSGIAFCVDFATDANNCGSCGTKCPSGLSCLNGGCVLICPQNSCGSDGTAFCTDFATDPNNCGTCAHKCSPAQTCSNGMCSCPLIPEQACFERASSTSARLNEEVQAVPSYAECVTFCKTNSPTSAYVSLFEEDDTDVYRCDCYDNTYTPIPLDTNTVDPPCGLTTNAAGTQYIYGHYIPGFTGVSEWVIRICP
jgi:hypothetical protein